MFICNINTTDEHKIMFVYNINRTEYNVIFICNTDTTDEYNIMFIYSINTTEYSIMPIYYMQYKYNR